MIKNILVIIVAGIGDLVLASKALRFFRNGYPKAKIHALVSSDTYLLAKNYPYIDKVWQFPIRELRKSKKTLFNILKLIRQLRKESFDMVINLYPVGSWLGALRMGLLISMIKSKIKAGENRKGFGLFLNKKININGGMHFCDKMMEIALECGGISDNRGI